MGKRLLTTGGVQDLQGTWLHNEWNSISGPAYLPNFLKSDCYQNAMLHLHCIIVYRKIKELSFSEVTLVGGSFKLLFRPKYFNLDLCYYPI